MKSGSRNKKKDDDSLIPFLILIFLCLIGSAFFIALFVKDLNMTLTKLNEEPIAHISFKYKSAHRKFIEREIWDTLQQKSPLYNGDTVRTAPLSEATIYFNEEDTIELYEDSIIQIFMDNGEVVINVGSGNVVVKAGENSKGIKVRVGKMYTTVQKGTSISTKKDDLTNATSFQVLSGGAYIFSDDSEESTFVSSEDQTLFTEDGKTIDTSTVPLVTVTSPAPNMKMLRTEDSSDKVRFKWTTQNMEYDHPVLRIADNKDFEYAKTYDLAGINGEEGIDIDIDSGKYYWEIYPANAGDKFKATSKMNIIKAEKPKLIVPANEYVLGYKNALPSVRFSWTDNEWASKYILELSHSPIFEGETIKVEAMDSYTAVSDLDDGIWYWRVIPTFGNDIQLPNSESETRYFLITQSETMPKVKLLQPTNNFTHNTKIARTAEAKKIKFSWKSNPDASFYNIKISRDSDFNFSDIDIETQENAFTLNKNDIEKLFEKSNEWFWAVIQGDENGNVSPLSDVRSFSIISGDYENRLVFPPNEYSVETSRIESVSFVWKPNFSPNGKQLFQVSTDSEFKNIVINNEVDKNDIEKSTSIKNLDAGTGGKKYYWRTIAKNDDGEEIISEVNSIKIMPPFKAPENASPGRKITIGVTTDKPEVFKWNAIEGADSYRFRIFQEGDEKNTIFEDNLVTENSIEVDLSGFSNGNYIWTVQANAVEKEISTRFTGETGRNEFGIRKIDLVELIFPENNAKLDGIEAFITPTTLQWNCREDDFTAIFRLYKKVGESESDYKLIQTIQNPKKSIQLPRLSEGKYKWNIEAMTPDGFDVSAKEERYFEISPIPDLKEPLLMAPPHNSTIGAESLKRNKSVTFRWKDVDGANDYIITIRDKNGKVLSRVDVKNKLNFTFKNISSLSRGKFSWNIEARQILKDGTIIRKRASRSANFKIDLPEINEVKLDDVGELYGL